MDLSNYLVSVGMAMSSAQTHQNHQIAVLDKAMDVQQAQGAAIADMLQQPVSFGHMLDVRV